ncbi:MAG: hypothetical protein ABGZ17_14490 [Planctomycetaceae bacterium]
MSRPDVEETIGRHKDAHAALEEMHFESIKNNEPLPSSAPGLFTSLGMPERFDQQKYYSRLESVWGDMQIAGTTDERDKLAAKVQKAEDKFKKEAPAICQELETTVARLTAQGDKMQAAVDGPTQELAVKTQAVIRLQDPRRMSEDRYSRYQAERSNVKKAFADLLQARARVDALPQRIADLKIVLEATDIVQSNPLAGMVNNLQLRLPPEVSGGFPHAVSTPGRLDKIKVQRCIDDCKAELAAAQKLIAEKSPEFDGRMSEVEELRNHYIR